MMLEAVDVRKQFGSQMVLQGISLTVEKGDVVAILGPSGSGKTTFLRCLNFLERADSGTLTLDGDVYDLHTAAKKEIARYRKKTGFVFQNYNLFQNLTVVQNITLGLTAGLGMGRREARTLAMDTLDRVGMAAWAQRYPLQLSGGQQQRVAIARALARNPEILFFDEPTSALDPELIGEVLGVMRELAREGMTMLIVTHEMDFARHVSNRVMFMEGGEVIESGPSRDFFEAPQQQRSRDFIRSIQEARQ